MVSEIEFLESWYRSHCDGDWEHEFGLELGTLDNPGWRLEIDLIETELEGRTFDRRSTRRSEDDWLDVWSDGSKFHAAAGPSNLAEAIVTFRRFVEGGFTVA